MMLIKSIFNPQNVKHFLLPRRDSPLPPLFPLQTFAPTLSVDVHCASQLSGVLQHIFNLSLSLQRVPVLWKTSCLVPVPKKVRPSTPSNYRPVALTSHLMKSLERLILSLLRPLVSSSLDPLQFAYQRKLGVEDTIIFLLHRASTHVF